MRTGWIIGVVVFYLIILAMEMWLTGGTVFENVVTSNAGTLIQPNIVSSGSLFGQVWAILSNIGGYIAAVVKIVFLWSPTVFVGYMLWVYWFVCFPIACAMIYGVVTLLRGGG